MFLEQQLIIQRALGHISRLPAGVSWLLSCTDEDGADDDNPTRASLCIMAHTDDALKKVLASFYGEWETLTDSIDGVILYWRTDGDLEITAERGGLR